MAEYLVACDLVEQGYRVHMASPGSYYDIILDDNGKLYRLQIKGTLKPKKINTYRFQLNANKKHCYFDLVAYVAIDRRIIAYETATSVNDRKISVSRFNSMSIAKAIADFNAKETQNTEHIELPSEI